MQILQDKIIVHLGQPQRCPDQTPKFQRPSHNFSRSQSHRGLGSSHDSLTFLSLTVSMGHHTAAHFLLSPNPGLLSQHFTSPALKSFLLFFFFYLTTVLIIAIPDPDFETLNSDVFTDLNNFLKVNGKGSETSSPLLHHPQIPPYPPLQHSGLILTLPILLIHASRLQFTQGT